MPMEKNRFTWGDSVRVSPRAPAEWRPGTCGSVVGFMGQRGAEAGQPDAGQPEAERGVMYTVEYGDGSSAEVPEAYLEPVDQSSVG